MKIHLRVQPRASKEEIVKLGGNSYKIYMHQPAIESRANQKLTEMLAEYFGTKKNRVRILSGLRSKSKVVEIVQ
ncbi:MAG: DUF167 domain-containing protein [Candidatus Omnitrophica bacterium]|nr:DUF167 domain-containing protein [Candidatus Omnitrophota bacterium]